QSQLLVNDAAFADSDDPNVNGPADPLVPGDEDPTRVLIQSAPAFQLEKISTFLTGDPSVLLAGETLRYTITVKNIGTDNAVDVVLRDDIPVNTQYLAGSTTLNGAPVADGPGGIAPLSAGIPVHAPEDPTPGAMRADASATVSNVATLVFDVIVDADVIDGTVISNQAFVSAVAGGVSDHPSDDPRTSIPDDPTRDVVGSTPLLFAAKDAELLVDAGTPGLVDPGDELRYTITVYNTGGVPASGVALKDSVPANTTYVADSLTLNGLPVGRPDAGVSPLIAGVPISSADLTPPLPGSGAGTITAGETAVIEFDLRVNAGVPGGTVISNQAVVSSEQLPDLPTDGDGNPATGPEPTVVVVGDGQLLSIAKQVAVVGGGPALAGSELEYVVRVVNVTAVPALDVVITDDLDVPAPGQLTYVDPSATMNGSAAGVSFAGSVLTADYSGTHGPLQPGGSVVLRFRAVIDAALPLGTTVTNTGVVTWNTPAQTASSSVSVDVGGMPGVGVLSGTLWHDSDFDRGLGGSERLLEGWIVELYRNDQLLESVPTDAGGTYRIGGLAPNDVSGDRYALRFTAPDAGANTAALGRADSPFSNGLQEITDLVVTSGSNLLGLNLPIDPDGVVYGAIARAPIAGATLTMLSAGGGASLPSLCFDDPAQQGQVTGSDGYYKFDLNFSDAACPSSGNYLIAVTPPGPEYEAGYSRIIPPISDASTTPLSVPACPQSPDDAVPATAQHCEAQPSEFAPPASVPPRAAGTNYHVHLSLDSSQVPGSSQIFNNHIPLDPLLDGAVAITKTTPSVNVSLGQLVPFRITFSNELGLAFADLSIVDRFPAGFRYVENSARIDGVPVEPTINGRELVWTDVGIGTSSTRSLVLLFAVGAGLS
ncbi:MAG: isopeptide-forming domain-containing fimbrial protein, partial [Planctomycetota bacterium]